MKIGPKQCLMHLYAYCLFLHYVKQIKNDAKLFTA